MQGFYGQNYYNGRSLSFLDTGKKNKAARKNAIFFDNELKWVSNLFMGRFEWKGEVLANLPPYHIETLLLYNGFCVAVNDDEYGLVILPANITKRNIYNYPTELHLYGINYSKHFPIDKCVIIRDNINWSIPILMMYEYCKITSDLLRAIDVYKNGLKKPVILRGTNEQMKTLEVQLQRLDDNEPFILLSNKVEIGEEPPELYNLPHTSDGLRGMLTMKNAIYNEMLAKIGISSNLLAKESSYQSSDELAINNQMIELSLQMATKCREDAAKELTDLVNSSITCEPLQPIKECDKETEDG